MKNLFETLKDIEKEVIPLEEVEIISLENATNRILAKDLYAQKNLPSFDNAALDGYAFNYMDLKEALSIKGVIFAGDSKTYEIGKNECYKIMTGAKMPKNADTILMVEDEYLENNKLIIKKNPKQFNARRLKGEELKQGEFLLKKGTRLNSRHIALLASQGIYKIEVVRKIRIGIFSSGNELKEPWQTCDEENIYNVNALSLMSILNYCEIQYLGIIKDDFNIIKNTLLKTNFDLLITSGGASMGEADFLEKAFDELNYKAIFKGVKARPARPSKLYKKDKQLALVLPGNPMAAYLSCFIFAKKIINLLNNTFEKSFKISAKMGVDLKIKKGRNNFILGNLENEFFIPFNNNQFGSGMILPLINSEFLLISEEKIEKYHKGDHIELLKL